MEMFFCISVPAPKSLPARSRARRRGFRALRRRRGYGRRTVTESARNTENAHCPHFAHCVHSGSGWPSASPMRARRLPEPVHAVAVIRLVSGHADSADGADQRPGLASGAAARNRPFPDGPGRAGSGKVRIRKIFRTARLPKKTFPCFFGVLCAHGRPPGGGAASSSAPALIAPGAFLAVQAGIRGRTGRWHSCTDRESAPERVRERRKRSWAGLWVRQALPPPGQRP